MSVLMLRIEGPMQAWGTHSHFTERDTSLEPTKSGIIGLLCSALGRKRNEDIGDLVSLRMGVRVDREGKRMKDFHTTLNVPKADPKARPGTVISNRYFLSDACFLIGLEGDGEILEPILSALNDPNWIVFLGRKSFPPSQPILLSGIMEGKDLKRVLMEYEWLGREEDDPPKKLRTVIETFEDTGDVRMDVPISFVERTFGPRLVKTVWVDTPIKEDS